MRQRIVCRACCVGMLLLAGALFAEHALGRAVFFDDEPDPSTGPVALFCALLGFLVLVCGEVAALRERVEQLERDRRAELTNRCRRNVPHDFKAEVR
jgi:hypothetical protein